MRLIKKNIFFIALITYLRRVKFEFFCIVNDVNYIYKNRKLISQIKKNSLEKTLLVCSLDFYKNKRWQVVSQTELWHQFSNQENVIFCGSIISYYLYGKSFKNIVSLEPRYNAPTISFSSNHNKVIVFVSDSHTKGWLPKCIKNSHVTDILTPYKKNLLDTGFTEGLEASSVHSFPWCVSNNIINKNIITSTRNDVLGFGQTGSKIYDLREWSFNTGELISFDYAGSGNKKYIGDDFFYWLRTFDACVVGVSSTPLYNCTVAKFFEIPSQGLLLFAFPSEDLSDFGFIDGENCIYINKYNFKSKIQNFKDFPLDYLEIRSKGLILIKDNHTVNCRVKYIQHLLNS
ncbi:hypothetical protein CMT41_02220 [Colwellia sp. MT41]|uniref:glycosyltransferase n=1 Tax=Colwellia sp. MT41 TaxID=58049 RepID=UPI00071763D7|nr:glycosyltransferase [Colwellia sp. MT41]ALO33658.1 hypothetical protein CMT41_02220 [Colwellia sp. MT41]